jgi:hypothetical protein
MFECYIFDNGKKSIYNSAIKYKEDKMLSIQSICCINYEELINQKEPFT